MSGWMRPPELVLPRGWARFDPIEVGAAHGMPRELAVAIWEQVRAAATDSAGRTDEELAERQFCADVAARCGATTPPIGKTTRVAMKSDGRAIAGAQRRSVLPRTPGRGTQVERDATRRLESVGGKRWRSGPAEVDDDRDGLDEDRVRALRDLLHWLGPDHALRQPLVETAASTDRPIVGRATRWGKQMSARPEASPAGRALWLVSERRAATLYRRAVGRGEVRAEDPAVEDALRRCGDGRPLPPSLLATMERELGVSLAGVRIHLDEVAANAARVLAADAFTIGEDVFFAEGKYAPDTQAGAQLVAHELAHVAQALTGRLAPASHGVQVSEPSDPLEREAEAVAAQVVARPALATAATGGAGSSHDDTGATRRPLALWSPPRSSTHALRAPSNAAAMAIARPAAQSDFKLRAGKDDFVISFELLPAAGTAGVVRVVVSPTDFARARQSLMKYWDVRGREVSKDDSWTQMGNVGTAAQPWVQYVAIADRARFDPALLAETPGKGALTWTFDWDGDARPEFSLRVDFSLTNTQRFYNFAGGTPGNATKFDYSYVEDDAWKYGYQGASAPRRDPDDFVDFLGGILTSKTTWEMAITMIPVVGEVVLLGEAVTGYSLFGDKLSTTGRIISGLAALLPVAGGVLAKGATKAGADLAKVAATVGRSEAEVVAMLRAAEKQGAEAATVEKWAATLKAGGKLTVEEAAQLERIVRQLEADQRVFRAAEQELGASRILRKGGKLEQTGPVSLKRLRMTLGRSGVSPSGYHLRKAAKADLDALRSAGTDPSTVYAWVSRDGNNVLLVDARGRPVITFTEQGLSSLEEAVKSFGHEAKHIQDFAAGMATSNEALAEQAGEELWELVQKKMGQ
jgi:hypothetical protein